MESNTILENGGGRKNFPPGSPAKGMKSQQVVGSQEENLKIRNVCVVMDFQGGSFAPLLGGEVLCPCRTGCPCPAGGCGRLRGRFLPRGSAGAACGCSVSAGLLRVSADCVAVLGCALCGRTCTRELLPCLFWCSAVSFTVAFGICVCILSIYCMRRSVFYRR